MKKHGKKYNQAIALVEKERIYTVGEAVELLERTNTVKFDPTVEIHFNLNIDPKYADQMIRSTISLPNGSGKTVRIGAFTDAGDEKELLALGATVAGGDDLVDIVATGKIDFDVAIATPAMMRKMGKIAKVLGPKGLMPNPKTGTVGDNLAAIVKEVKAGKFEFKNDKQGNVHSLVGKLSFGGKKLQENIEFFLKTVRDVKPTGVKNGAAYINSIYVCNAMGPSIRIEN
ncbi:50S ribosomal protein L1 [Candidatus Gracilibacteria bacterium]|nr:50S ribosomal protein L1 [Candidatus Gracilibacteria bacterium]OIO76693.1 MAG: 50S ribosomal protein L1 [Candidatus Gracilibacteria bacterium CG1_02_38_174]PIQ11878.1 MAG: 50S ribosomal protein L1 [Candidatus Gracilibacteria bacterium CG18_big_fil_WC_8_21_14_2_50_38_16]PJC56679.1 MAG: 50S ribosomal protein L1 [Candidatus Gracilibacteria bacterium CG_4_9_14_0_2_um_filter_38_7]